jgi:hypothetical protein
MDIEREKFMLNNHMASLLMVKNIESIGLRRIFMVLNKLQEVGTLGYITILMIMALLNVLSRVLCIKVLLD